MGLNYEFILWNNQKKAYDKLVFSGIVVYLLLFISITFIFNPETSIETLVLRSLGSLALVLLHIILAIGPLARINKRFLPLLYNRRHLGVSMCILALIHGGLALFQFHGLGDEGVFYSLFTSNMDYNSLSNFPFQVLGFLALLILLLMASTSHDFFLKNLTPMTWKSLHMMVYVAYVLIFFHVLLGAFQQETYLLTMILMSLGFSVIAVLHLWSAFKGTEATGVLSTFDQEEWVKACHIDEIEDSRAKIFIVGNQPVALFRYGNKFSAIHNQCKHQGGPLGEGKIVDGCVTCPWHGYQYLPHNGQSPPPFEERVGTYKLKIIEEVLYISNSPLGEGVEINPLILGHEEKG